MSQEFIQLLEDLVAIPSPSTQEAEASAYLRAWLAKQGFAAQIDEVGNAVGVKGSGPQEIMLLGHIDTFPDHPPLRREGDLLYGRGSVDAKGPLCTFAAAASLVEVPSAWRVTVVGAVEEEYATSKGARHILTQRQDKVANANKPPKICIIGEPSHWDRVTIAYKGRLLLHLGLRLPYTHSAGTDKLPAERGVEIWQAVQKYAEVFNEGRQGVLSTLDPSLRSINTSDAGSFGQVDLSLSFRLPLDLRPDDLETQLRDLLEVELTNVAASLKFVGHERTYRASKSNNLVRAFLKVIRAKGGKPRFVSKSGTADMNVVGPVWECPILAYGPGDSTLDHTPHEHLDLQEYLKAIDVLQGVLQILMT